MLSLIASLEKLKLTPDTQSLLPSLVRVVTEDAFGSPFLSFLKGGSRNGPLAPFPTAALADIQVSQSDRQPGRERGSKI